jgi:8-oxo-dGTP pyrophosphatase MutT (NUDIX family)
VAVGISAIVYDEHTFFFEVTRPRHWGRRADGSSIVGIGGIGGRIRPGESALACLRREAREEIGVGLWVEPEEATALICDGEVVDWLDIASTRRLPVPYMINLLPPQLERADRPDHLAIVSFRGMTRRQPCRKDLFGLLTIERAALEPFFERSEWPLDEAVVLPGVSFDLESALPSDSLLRPTLTGRAFKTVLRHRSLP